MRGLPVLILLRPEFFRAQAWTPAPWIGSRKPAYSASATVRHGLFLSDDADGPLATSSTYARKSPTPSGWSSRAEYIVVAAERRLDVVPDGQVDIMCDATSVIMTRRERVDFRCRLIDGASVLTRIGQALRRTRRTYLANRSACWRVRPLAGCVDPWTVSASRPRLSRSAITAPARSWYEADKIDAYFADRGIIAAMLRRGGRPGELGKQYFSYETYALVLPRDDGPFRLLVD